MISNIEFEQFCKRISDLTIKNNHVYNSNSLVKLIDKISRYTFDSKKHQEALDLLKLLEHQCDILSEEYSILHLLRASIYFQKKEILLFRENWSKINENDIMSCSNNDIIALYRELCLLWTNHFNIINNISEMQSNINSKQSTSNDLMDYARKMETVDVEISIQKYFEAILIDNKLYDQLLYSHLVSLLERIPYRDKRKEYMLELKTIINQIDQNH